MFLSRARDSTTRFVRRSVGWSHFTFFYDFIFFTSLLLPKWSGDLIYGPCPPTRDFGSRVSGLVFDIISFPLESVAFCFLLLLAFMSC